MSTAAGVTSDLHRPCPTMSRSATNGGGRIGCWHGCSPNRCKCVLEKEGGAMTSVPGQFIVQRVVRLAVDVFRSPGGSEKVFREGLAKLNQLVSQLTAQDVGFDPRWVRDTRPYRQDLGVAPMTYVRLFENDSVSIGIFILKNGFTLPTHDHPHMHGVLKVLHGHLLMQSFTRVPAAPGILNGVRSSAQEGAMDWDMRQTPLGPIYHTVKETPRRLGATDPPCLLTPNQSNIHQIRAVDGPVAFLDILAPPYDDDEHIYHNFRELEPEKLRQLTGGEVASDGWLIRVRNNSFFSDSAPYRGPPLDDIR
ncbi:2-aminoethanethiol dioxygenase-like isoform X2 [Pollicipes pollicipes]|uniref:2-aminoethanethiol dioxygenase-like isoform X2 n=1 Tax=Pollicipes pollicipes TaxID=41117 RepID=UPI0018857317|nr:2-aminoethanethiol dioxygenase-like isoform X2 [Pollicipes pollicipes]